MTTKKSDDETVPAQPGTEQKENATATEKKYPKGQQPTQTQFEGIPAPQEGTENIDI